MTHETVQRRKRCFQIDASDNVATLLENASAETLELLGAGSEKTVISLEPVKLGHKVAVAPIAVGAPIVKYGVRIGIARLEIPKGSWVHLHNCQSLVDERSNRVDFEMNFASEATHG